MSFEGWVGVLALVVAIAAIVVQRANARAIGRVQSQQAAAIARLLSIEEARVERAAAVPGTADAFGDRSRAGLRVSASTVAMNASRKIAIRNDGTTDATVTGLVAWMGDRVRGPGIRETWSGEPVTIGPLEEKRFPVQLLGAGLVNVELTWTDGTGVHVEVFDVDFPERRT